MRQLTDRAGNQRQPKVRIDQLNEALLSGLAAIELMVMKP
jgi:hypothetical protein